MRSLPDPTVMLAKIELFDSIGTFKVHAARDTCSKNARKEKKIQFEGISRESGACICCEYPT